MKRRLFSAGKTARCVGEFFKSGRTRDSATNQVLRDGQTLGTKHFSIEPLTGEETLIASQVISECTHLIRMRWWDLTVDETSCWLVFKGKTYEIKAALDLDGLGVELVLFAIKQP